jgi:4-aminobutyrate aminotransferase-like enzyme
MGNAHPLSATVTRRDLIDGFSKHAHYFNTFGGNPVSCAAGLAVLDVIEDEGLQANALEVGLYLNERLRELADRYEVIGDVRGDGLFKAVELVTDRESKAPAATLRANVVEGLRRHRVLAGTTGIHDNVVKLRPPMVFSKENADHFIGIFDEVLTEATASTEVTS